MQFRVCLCVRIRPTPAETSQDSVPTCVPDCAGAGDAESALNPKAAATERTVRIIICKPPVSARAWRQGRHYRNIRGPQCLSLRQVIAAAGRGLFPTLQCSRKIALEPEVGGGASCLVEA